MQRPSHILRGAFGMCSNEGDVVGAFGGVLGIDKLTFLEPDVGGDVVIPHVVLDMNRGM